MYNSSISIQEQTSQLIAEVFNCCPTIVQHQIMQHMQLKVIDHNAIFIKHSDEPDGIYIVISGGLKLYQEKNDKKNILHYYSPKDVIGLPFIINSIPANYYVHAIEDSVLSFIPQNALIKIMQKYPHSFFSMMKKLHEKTERLEKRGTSIMTDSAELTVVKAIKDLRERFGTDQSGYIKIQIPVKELANYVGMSKTNLYRILQLLKEKSILSHHINKYKLN